MNRIYVYPWDQLSKSAGAIAKGLNTQKLLRKGSKYRPQDGDVIVNWGASDIGDWLNKNPYAPEWNGVKVLNRNVQPALDKVAFFERLKGTGLTPAYELDRAAAEDFLRFPILCRTKTKGCDGAGIVIAESKLDMVPAKLFVELEPKTAEYRVHIGRNRDGSTSIIGVQQKFLPNGHGGDKRLRTTANGCYFVWTLKGEQVEAVCPPTVLAVASAAFKLFPELDFAGADVIWNEATGKATVIEFNSAPEMTVQSVARYGSFFQQFRVDPEPVVEDRVMAVIDANPQPYLVKPWKAAYEAWAANQPEAQDQFYFELMQNAFHAGWDARKAKDAPDMPLEREQFVNYMYGVHGDRIDVV